MSGGGESRARAAGEREEFAAFFPQIVRDLTEDGLGHPEVGDAVARLKQVSKGRGGGTGVGSGGQGAAGEEPGRGWGGKGRRAGTGGGGPGLLTSPRSRRCWSTTRRAGNATEG